jgi:CRISPR/Cas system CMR-associated protein Cmr3 (group 5 of RAMP superfamily)
LRFEDNGELFVVKRSGIESIIEGRAIVGADIKRRVAKIEAQGRINIAILQTI